ncbi:hypothetical protein C8R43DRAFT_1133495 [Mycena crocata]|nr:hypothetical protein C8R43DRAFT_1133495 [Mycena crocata]
MASSCTRRAQFAATSRPSTPRRGSFEQAAAVELSKFDPNALAVVGEMLMKPMFGIPNDLEAAKKALVVLDAKLDAYDVNLGKQRYVAGDKPNVARWYNELVARPSWNSYLGGVNTTTVY